MTRIVHRKRTLHRAFVCAPALTLAGALFTGCNTTPAPTPAPPAATVGALTVNVAGLPTGVNSSVTVSGPGGFNQSLTGTKTFEKLAPGSYAVAAANVSANGATYAGAVTGSLVAVKASETATSSVTYAALTGVLNLNIAGLPAGMNAQIALTGPGGFSQNLTASAILPGLNIGAYTATPTPIKLRQPSGVVDAIFDGTGGTATVSSGAVSSLSAGYAQRPGTGKLWMPQTGGQVSGFAASILGGAAGQSGVLTSPTGGNPEAVAVDAEGNLWIASSASHTLEKYAVAQLGQTGTVKPSVTISAGAGANAGVLSNPAGLAFDAGGNLWVTNLSNNSVVKFTPAQLAQSGTPLPAVTISSTADFRGSLNQPGGLAFDAGGNLWVTNRAGDQPLVKYTPAQLASGGRLTPDVVIAANNGSLNFPVGLAFDSGGNLWVANYQTNAVVMFLPVHLAASGSPAADLTLTSSGLSHPEGLAFDAGGNLWVSNLGNGTLVQFKGSTFLPAGLVSTAAVATTSPAPSRTIGLGQIASGGFAFDPPPANLPIAQVR